MRVDPKPSNGRKRPMAKQSLAHAVGQDLTDPNRADKLLRRFSWQEKEANA